MRSFLSKSGWKTTILKMKIRKKVHGIVLLTTSLAVLTWILIMQAFFLMNSGTINTIQTERVASQAVQNAQLDREKLIALDFDDLDAKGAHGRQPLEDVNDDRWESEVTLSPETTVQGLQTTTRMRIAHIAVYRKGETAPRYNLDVPLTELLSQRYKELKELIEKLDSRVTVAEKNINNLDTRVTTIENKVGGLESDVSGLNGTVNGLSSNVSGLSGKINSLASKLAECCSSCSGGSGSTGGDDSHHEQHGRTLVTYNTLYQHWGYDSSVLRDFQGGRVIVNGGGTSRYINAYFSYTDPNGNRKSSMIGGPAGSNSISGYVDY